MKRRNFIASAGAITASAAIGPFFHVRPARADAGELVVVGWGGSYDDALRRYVFDPFEKATGAKVKHDAPPENAKVKAMVDSGNVTWDVIMTDIPAVLTLMKDDLLEPIDYSMIDKDKLAHIPKDLQHSHAVGMRIYSFNIVYNSQSFSPAKHPGNWPAVWDGKAYPGGRTWTFGGGVAPQLEIALLGDGVPMDKVYPLDVERAWKSMGRLRPLVTKWYTSHAQAIQLIGAGEVAVGCTVGPRGIAAKWKGAPIDVDYNQGKMASDNWCLVKNPSKKKLAMEFINFALDGMRQAQIAKEVPYGPSNGQAFDHLTEKESRDLNTSPDNIEKQFWWNVAWWGTPGSDGKTERERQAERYAAWMVKG